jgi:glycosyltransferase involved in cell wall biosynthesis
MISEKIGIVVIGRNEGRRLIECLASLKVVSAAVVYVDSGSIDDSVLEARHAGASAISLELGRPFTAARARNEGFAALKKINPNTEFVQFIDGDCLLVDTWLDVAVSFMEAHSDVALVCGRRRERFPDKSIYNRLCDLEWDTPIGESAGSGGDSLVRAQAFEQVGGFRSEIMAGEEPEMCVRFRELGWKIWRLDAEMTQHDVNMTTFRQWWRRALRSGYGYAEVCMLLRSSRFRIYQRETARAIFWGGAAPAFIALSSCYSPWALGLALVYPLQLFRLIKSHKPRNNFAQAFFTVLGKFPEFQGVAKFYWYYITGRNAVLIEYKK